MIGRLTRNTEPHQKCSSSRPDATGPSAAPLPEMPAQMAIALARSRAGKTLVRIDSVDGMTNAAPMPMIARAAMSTLGTVGEGAERRAGGEDQQAGLQGALAAEAVAEGGGGEQQAGEDQAVGVDDPLDLGVGGAEAALLDRLLQRRQGHVEHGVADDDDDQRRAQHGERLPPPGVDVGVDAVVVDRLDVVDSVTSASSPTRWSVRWTARPSSMRSVPFRYVNVVIEERRPRDANHDGDGWHAREVKRPAARRWPRPPT